MSGYDNAYEMMAAQEAKEKAAVEAKFKKGFSLVESYIKTQQELVEIKREELELKKTESTKLDSILSGVQFCIDALSKLNPNQ